MTTSTTPVTGVDFVNIFTQDIDKATEFYGGVLGLPVGKRYGKMPGVEYETGNLTLAVLQADAFGLQFSNSKAPIAFKVDDVKATREQLEEQGVKFMADTMDSGVCFMAFFEDPDGNTLCLHHRYAPPDARPPGIE